MDLFCVPSVTKNWHIPILESWRRTYPDYQFDPDDSAFVYPQEVGKVRGQFYNLCPEHLSVCFTESNLNQALSLTTLPTTNGTIYTIHFNLSGNSNYFQVPAFESAVLSRNGLRACLLSNTQHPLVFRQEPGHSFKHLQISVSKAHLTSLVGEMLGKEALAYLPVLDTQNFTQFYDIFLEDSDTLNSILRIFRKSSSSPQENRSLLLEPVQLLMTALLKKLFSARYESKPNVNPQELKRIEMIRELISNQITHKYSLLEAASICNMSISKFNKLFRKITNHTFAEYYNKLKMEVCMKQICNNCTKTITDIAFEAGYGNLPQFTKAFKNHYGKPPSFFYQSFQKKAL